MAWEEICEGGVEEFVIAYKGKEYKFKKKELSWAKVNEIVTESTEITTKGTMRFNLGTYYEKCLQAMLVETPWPENETVVMLKRLGIGFGSLLEAHAPRPENLVGEQDFFPVLSNVHHPIRRGGLPEPFPENLPPSSGWRQPQPVPGPYGRF